MSRTSTNEQYQHGWLIIDKLPGLSSAKIVAIAKKALGAKKVGHAGTLDPLASGILPLAFGEATKTMRYVLTHDKEYIFTLRFGEQTDTDDLEGKVVATNLFRPSQEMLKNTLSGFVGEILQVPPIFSALKIDGQRSYKLARQGIEPNMQPRKIKIYSLELLHYDGEEASLKVHCGKGTYVRALARDIAVKLGTVAYITELRRTKLGNFSIDQGILLDNLLKLVHTLEPIDKFMSVEIALDDILAIDISESEMHSLRQGKSIICEHNMLEDGVIKALYNDKLIALGEYQAGYFKPNRVFNH